LTEPKGLLYNQVMIDVEGIKKRLLTTKVDQFWAFADKTRKDTAYITYGYHKYPAKFIPQVASSLVERYTKEGVKTRIRIFINAAIKRDLYFGTI
jgi:hypothetical protein